ncbi:MAG: hypothetical protein JO362_14575 [Streptomycetaceae bacterium]|nr:hypothetical protein [Streptomycetaceae bacterium]
MSVTVPGDSANIPGNAVMQRVKGTLTVPSGCTHQPVVGRDDRPLDGFVYIFLTAPGDSSSYGADDTPFVLDSSLPGPGLPQAGAAGVVTLYRAVDSTEANLIAENGNKYTVSPNVQGKYMYPTKEQAEALAKMYEDAGFGDYIVTSATIPEDALASSADSISIAGEGDAYLLLPEAVEVLSEVAVE